MGEKANMKINVSEEKSTFAGAVSVAVMETLIYVDANF